MTLRAGVMVEAEVRVEGEGGESVVTQRSRVQVEAEAEGGALWGVSDGEAVVVLRREVEV